jgi:hypothetical protein
LKDSYDLQDEPSLRSALRDLKGFWKLWSACLLQNASLPTLRGLIVTRRSSPEVEKQVHNLLDAVKATKALIRHDIRNEAPPYPRGGFLVPERLVPKVLDFFFGLNRIVAIYEPADPLLNSYNLNVLFETTAKVWVEVVGPGFDASDLQRGDLSPHEVFSIVISAVGEVAELRRVSVVDERTYEGSRRLRLKKIERKLEEWPTPELAQQIRENSKVPLTLREYLKALHSPLSKVEPYIPVSEAIGGSTIAEIVNSDVIKLFQCETGVGFPLNFSTSQIDEGRRQVYWDIVSPGLKFQGLERWSGG